MSRRSRRNRGRDTRRRNRAAQTLYTGLARENAELTVQIGVLKRREAVREKTHTAVLVERQQLRETLLKALDKAVPKTPRIVPSEFAGETLFEWGVRLLANLALESRRSIKERGLAVRPTPKRKVQLCRKKT